MENVLIIPGLGDDARYTKFLSRNWERKYNIRPYVVTFGWSGDSKEFEQRFKKMEKYLDDFLKENKNVSILGISAGGSAVINLFSQRTNNIKHVVTVCGRLKDSNVRKMWNHKAKDLGVFIESVKLSEKNISKLNPEEKKKILNIRPLYDDIVPVRTMTIDGANNKEIFAAQHMISIFLSMTKYSKTIADFVKS